MASSILVLEDDELFNETLQDFLEQEGYDVDAALDPRSALDLTYRRRYDAYLLDINLPYENGLSFLHSLRQSGDETLAIFLTSREDKASLLEGFRIGGDEYMRKPVDLEELGARLRALLRRVHRVDRLDVADDVTLDCRTKRLYRNGRTIEVTPKAVELLMVLLEAKGDVVASETIEARLWPAGETVSFGALRVYVARLNKIFGKRIENVRGVGYRWRSEDV